MLVSMLIESPVPRMLAGLFVLAAGLIVYFLPTAIARKKSCFGSVFALNFFLGWTFVGWVIALAWALKDSANPPPMARFPQPAAAPPRLCCYEMAKASTF
jgi:type IV secretory pathway TrbL component